MKRELSNIESVIKITASNPLNKDCSFSRIVLRKITLKGQQCFQAETVKNKQSFHENIDLQNIENWLCENVQGKYKQVCFVYPTKDVTYLYSSKGAVKRLEKSTAVKNAEVSSNNRKKNYLINEGDNVPVFVDLGIFTSQFKVVNSMYDKFKQINRFVEILNDVFAKCNEKQLTILDFGCGKSYLTFIIYHYFAKIRNIDVKIIGYDLKADVVKKCNELADKYGYSGLTFVVADVSKDKLYDEKIDAVVSLHACDTATDYALYYAISHNAKYIFSVPCCQHEINSKIANGGDLDVLLKYGIIKERVSALLTDSIRAMILEDQGYSVDVMEFVDLAHSPKNLMIRAVKTHGKNNKNSKRISDLISKYQFEQTLYGLIQND